MDKSKILSSFVFTFIERLLVKGIGLVISVILARMLAPEDFGMIAIMTVFINLSQTIIQSGLNTALIQKKEVTEDDYSTVMVISCILSFVMILIIYLMAPLIENIYESSNLTLPLRIYTIVLIFGAFNSVQIARMQKKMQFKDMMICSLLATIASGLIGVILAYIGCGIWALVAYYMSNVVFTSLIILIVKRWVPKMVFSFSNAKALFSYGWKMLVSAILCSVYNDIRSLIIGKRYSTSDLGYYNRGQQFPNIISTTIDNAVQSVMFPTLATVQDSTPTVKSILKKSMSLGALLVFPAMFGLAAVGENFITVLLTEKWAPCIVYLQYLCFAEANIPLTSSSLIAIKAIGRSDVYMKLEFVRRIAMILILAASIFFANSVEAIALGYLISAWIDVIIISVPIRKLIGYSLFEQIGDLWKIAVASVIMMVPIYILSYIRISVVFTLLLQIFFGAVTYVVACKTLKIESYDYAKKTIFAMVNGHNIDPKQIQKEWRKF